MEVTATSGCLTEEGARRSRTLQADTLIMANSGATLGVAKLLKIRCCANDGIAALVDQRLGNREFLCYYLNTQTQYLRDIVAPGNGQPNLNTTLIGAIPVPFPSEPEQRAIAHALKDIDRLCTALERLVAKKRSIRQGMLQQLLTGRTRLPGFDQPWTRATLGDLGTFLKGRGVKRNDVRRSGVPCLRYGELYTDFANYTSVTRSFVSRDVAATALPIRFGDLLFAGSGETREEIGMCVAYVGEKAAVAGGDIVVLRVNGFNPIYLATLANTPPVANQKARAGQGGAVVHISGRALAAIRVEMPPRPEQDAIAEVVKDCDHEIDLVKQRLRKAQAVKQGMMQQLLTGKIRLPVAEAVA
jgi:type I restriction enzyme S subunit